MNKEGKHESPTWDFYSPRGENRRNGPQDGKRIWKPCPKKNLKASRQFPLGKRRLGRNDITGFKYLKRQHTKEESDLFFSSRGELGLTALSERQHGICATLEVKKMQL